MVPPLTDLTRLVDSRRRALRSLPRSGGSHAFWSLLETSNKRSGGVQMDREP